MSTNVANLQRLVEKQIAIQSQSGQGMVYQKMTPIKTDSLNPLIPVWDVKRNYSLDTNGSITGSETKAYLDKPTFKEGKINQETIKYTIPYATNRSLQSAGMGGNECTDILSRMVLGVKDIFMEYNVREAIVNATYTNGTNVFAMGQLSADNIESTFRQMINESSSYLLDEVGGVNPSHKLLYVIPEQLWNKLTATQGLIDAFRNYGSDKANLFLDQLSATFSQNSQVDVEFVVANTRILENARVMNSDLVGMWNEDNIYGFTVSSDKTSRSTMRRFEGETKMLVENKGFDINLNYYFEDGLLVDLEKCFTKITVGQ